MFTIFFMAIDKLKKMVSCTKAKRNISNTNLVQSKIYHLHPDAKFDHQFS